MQKFQKVVVLGGNGNMGVQLAALIAGFGNCQVVMMMRDAKDGDAAIRKAVQSVKSEAIKNNLKICVFPDDIKKEVASSDWILECLAENYEIKKQAFLKISEYLSQKTIVSTNTSSFAVEKLAEFFPNNLKSNFCGTHFFNPPLRLTLCELIPSSFSDKSTIHNLNDYLRNILRRNVILVKDTPLFVANRIGFQFINEALFFAKRYKNFGGGRLIENLLGGLTGRVMPPLETINFVGLPVAKEIINNLTLNYKIKNQIEKWDGKIDSSVETSHFVSVLKEYVSQARYSLAFEFIQRSQVLEAKIINHFVATYVNNSFFLIDEGVVKSIESVDLAMSLGFNWAPPSYILDLYGGVKNVILQLNKEKIKVAKSLQILDKKRGNLFNLWSYFDPRAFFRA